MPIDPRIAEILRQRREQGMTIEKTVAVQAQVQPRPLPTGPVSSVRPTPFPSGAPTSVTPVPMPSVQVPALDVPATETAPLDDSELAERLAAILPAADRLIRRAILDIKSDGKLSWSEALLLAPEIRTIVSEVVGKLVPQIKGTSARELVILVLAQLLTQYVSPSLPAPLRGWLTAQTLRTLVQGLEYAYQTWVKPKLGKKPTIQFTSSTAAH